MSGTYFDCNATTPVHPRVREAMLPYLGPRFGNPGCAHSWGLEARRACDKARQQTAALLGARPDEIVFTSGATEADNLALLGTLPSMRRSGLATTAVEHPAILGPARELASRGVEVAVAPVDNRGVVDSDALLELCTDRTRLVSVMLANNETGVIQPVARAAGLVREKLGPDVLVHSDAAQAVGKIPVNVRELGVDLLTVAGHKMYAPKGVGALFVRQGVTVRPLMFGGGQEGGVSPGTENVPHLVALGEACAMAAEDLAAEATRQRQLGQALLTGLHGLGADFRVWGEGAERLPQTLCVGFRDLRAGDILSGLVARDVGASGGAACHAGETSVSHVLTAMGADMAYAPGTIRLSWGRLTSEADVDRLITVFREVLAELRG